MAIFGPVSLRKMFVPTTPLLEIFIRGTVTYISIFLLLRIVLKRQSGSVTMTDLLVLVLLADAAQEAMAGGYTSITEGVFLVAVIIFWSFLMDWLGYRSRFIERLVHPPSLLLVRDGKMLRQNMRKELITPDELMSQLREQGVDDIAGIRRAYLEGDGRISVVTGGERLREAPERKNT